MFSGFNFQFKDYFNIILIEVKDEKNIEKIRNDAKLRIIKILV